MKKSLFYSLVFTAALNLFGAEPIIKHIYTADPSAHVFEGKLYLYPSHDPDKLEGFFPMVDYHVFSSADLKNWKDHGVALDMKHVSWVKDRMWAPDIAKKGDTYFFYFPARDKNDVFKIGVATSQSPAGPFMAKQEPIKGSFSIDPGVFTDEDGETYMYFGGRNDGQLSSDFPYVAKMDETMLQFAEKPREVIIQDQDGQRIERPDPKLRNDLFNTFFEAPWIHKYKNTYYLSYSTGRTHNIAYATSTNPYGPFTYQGILLPEVLGWTNHHSIVKYQNKWWLFYHDSSMSGGETQQRCVKMAEILYRDDGTMIAPLADTKAKLKKANDL